MRMRAVATAFAAVLVCSLHLAAQQTKRLCGECFAPGDRRWTYCERCGGRLVNLKSPEPRQPRLLRGKTRCDLRYRFRPGDSFKTYMNTITDFSPNRPAGKKPDKAFMDLHLMTQVVESGTSVSKIELTAALRSLMANGKNVTEGSAEGFSKLRVEASVTDRGQVVPGTVSSQGTPHGEVLLAQAIASLPAKPVARKDTWPAKGFLSPAACSALLPKMFRDVPTHVQQGQFVLADVTRKNRKKCAQIVGHFTIQSAGRKTLGGKPADLRTRADYEYVVYFAIDEGYAVDTEVTGYINSTIQSRGTAREVSAKVHVWSRTKKTVNK